MSQHALQTWITGFLFLASFSVVDAQVNVIPTSSWKAFPVFSQGENIEAIADSGFETIATRGLHDGLGAHLLGNNLTIWVNHETTPAAIERVDLDLAAFQQAILSTMDGGQTSFPPSLKTGVGFAYETIFDASYHAVNNPNPVASGTVSVDSYGDANFARFCSGTSYLANTFGNQRGFVDDLYLTGEEVDDGQFYALDENLRAIWQIPDFGAARWENGALIDTGNTTHIAFLLSADNSALPGDPIRLYVGEKGIDSNSDGQIDTLERNGLRGGTVYFFDPDPGFSQSDLPDGIVTGTWTTDIGFALLEDKLEDIHANPFDSSEVVFSDQTDGVYRMDLNLIFDEDGLDVVNSTTTIFQIVDDDAGLVGNPDNLTWSQDGLIYVQQDGDGDGIYRMNPNGTGIELMAFALSEPSGIIDVSVLVGLNNPGQVFLSSVQGNGSSGGQLLTLVAVDELLCQFPGSVVGRLESDLDSAEETIVPGPGADPGVFVGQVDIGSSDLELGSDWDFNGIEQMVGMRFNNLNIPPGVTITSAFVRFTADDLTDGDPAKQAAHDADGDLIFMGERSGNAAAFSDTNFDLTARPKTNGVVWNSPTWTTGAVGDTHDSVDVSPIIQEIIDQEPSWQSGNAIALFVATGGDGTVRNPYVTREAESEGFSGPVLFVEFVGSPGDINRDGFVNLLDIAPFVEILSSGGFQLEADINGDGIVNLLDVGPFVDLLAGG